MTQLFGRYDRTHNDSNTTSPAPPNAKFAVIFGEHLSDILFTEERPIFIDRQLNGTTCDGYAFVIGQATPSIYIALSVAFPRTVGEMMAET